MTTALAPQIIRTGGSSSRTMSRKEVEVMVSRFRQKRYAAVVPGFKFREGFIYNTVRAISARINQNFDAWPSEELKVSYRSFLGKPCFVNHHNEDPLLARGVVVAARYVENGKDKYVEVIQETDGKRFPLLGHELRTGGLDSVSMGVEAGFTICSICSNRATDITDMCGHVKFHKGEYLRHPKTGKKTLVYENCFVPGTAILMDGATTKPIEHIATGDRVIDHLGDSRLVIGTMSRLVTEDVVKIHRAGSWLQAPEMTTNHPVLTIRSEDASYPCGTYSRERFTRQLNSGRLAPEFVEAGQVREGDWVCEVKPRTDATLSKIVTADYVAQPGHPTRWTAVHTLPDTLELTEDFGLFVGWFLSEGSVNRSRTQVDFGLHGDEERQGNEIVDLAQKCFGLTSSTVKRYGNSRRVTIFSAPLAQLMSIFGTSSVTKGLPDDFLSAPACFLSGVARGHELGDGLHGNELAPAEERKAGVRPHVHYHFSVSEKLTSQLYLIHLMLGNTPSHSVNVPTQTGRNADGHWKPLHKVWWKSRLGSKGKLSYGPWTFTRVRQVETRPYSGPVYNLEVADTHTYTAEGIAVHNCHKLGFFELSYVFDPADETAVVSRVIAASREDRPVPHVLMRYWLKQAYGQFNAPNVPKEVDTLRDDDEEGDDDPTDTFHNWITSPSELQAPDTDRAKQLDRHQESQGMDGDRRVEDVEGYGVPAVDDPSDHYEDDEDVQPAMPINPPASKKGRRTTTRGAAMSRRRYYAADEDGGAPPQDDDQDGPPQDAQPQDPDALVAEAEQDLSDYDQASGGGDDFGGDDGSGGDDDGGYPSDDGSGYDDSGDDSGYDGDDGGDGGDYGDDGSGGEGPPDGDDGSGGGGDLPPWLEHQGRVTGQGRGPVNRAARRANKRAAAQGGSMSRQSLATRQRTAQTMGNRGRRHFTADESGHTDGGPYGVDDSQGAQEDIFISQVPAAEAVETADGEPISNTPNNLVANRGQFDPNHYQRLADVIAAMPVAERRAMALKMARQFKQDNPRFNELTFFKAARCRLVRKGNRVFFAEELEAPDKVNPELSGTDSQDLKGDDFESLALDNVETQPKDASIHAFKAFDRWLANTTGRTARQHGNANFIRRAAVSYAKNTRNPQGALEGLFPTLDYVLAHARKSEGRTAMNRYAEDESLDLAAPGGRIDVEAPTKNVTDADAQSSQFDLGDYADNAGDNLADPDLSPTRGNAGTWAPDEGKEASTKLASSTEAMRCAEAHIAAMPHKYPQDDRWKLAAHFETLRSPVVRDRTRLCEQMIDNNKIASRRAARKVTAGTSRGTANGLPQGFGQRSASLGARQASSNDPTSMDSSIFF